MKYELYTWPHCDECEKVKKFFEEKGIVYETAEVFENTEAKRKIRDAEKSLEDRYRIRKNLRGKIIFPILIERSEKGVERIAQGYDDIRNLFG